MSKHVSNFDDIPHDEVCYVILNETSVHFEGDERSRTNPGHGYPAHTDHFVEVKELFYEEEPFKSELRHQIAVAAHSVMLKRVRGFKLTPYVAQTVIELMPAEKG